MQKTEIVKKEKGFTPTPNYIKSGLFNLFNSKKNKFYQNNHESKNLVEGFTLIEVMISTALFTVIMIIGITAILGVNNTYRKTRTMRSAIDNISFMMEDMARNIRLGYRYRCVNTTNPDLALETPLDGQNCRGIAFEPYWDPTPGDIDDQVIYYIDQESVFKSTNGSLLGDSAKPMNSIDVKIDESKSGFTIVGASEPGYDIQPVVLIRISGVAESSRSSTSFELQTTVSQRLIDAAP